MAKMHDSFTEFCNALGLSSTQIDEVRGSRNANRDAIRSWMCENDKGEVRFSMQGSFPMFTTISPPEGEEYDIDDGVYLCAYEDTEKDDWPSCIKVHDWIKSATEGRTKVEPIDKDACVRVSYAHGYHVDIPIYILKDGHAYLARKNSNWELNDAKEFKDWVNEKNPADGQLKRLIKYLKRWKDHNGIDLKGIAITILAVENYEGAPNKDDDALRYTVESICNALGANFKCVKPLEPYDDLFERYSSAEANNILSSLQDLLETLKEAHMSDNARDASIILRKAFGDDFPESSDESMAKASVAATSAPGILKRSDEFGQTASR